MSSGKSTRDVYNSKVANAEYVTRPLGNKDTGKNVPFAHHAGVRVTTTSGDSYLVHKGPNYGRSSDTVVTPASNMSDRWKTTGSKPVSNSTVGDVVSHGKPNQPYSLTTSNCQHAANSMWKNTK